MKKATIALILFCLYGSWMTIQAQNVISASGGSASDTGGTLSYTIFH